VSRNPDGTGLGATSGTVDSTCNGQPYSIQCQLSGYYAAHADGLSGVNVCITAPSTLPGDAVAIGDPITVHTSYTYTFITGLFGLTDITLNATQTERAELSLQDSAVGVDQNGDTCP